MVEGNISFLKELSSKLLEVLLCINIGEAFLYTHTSGEKSFNMLISFLEEDFLEFLFDKVVPHLELREIIFIASFDR